LKQHSRPDLSNTAIVIALGMTLISMALILSIAFVPTPGSAMGQSAAFIGVIFLLTPFFFSILKRSDRLSSPPKWFIAHVLLALLGSVFIALHVRHGNWLSPPGFVLLCLLFLLLQGTILRVVLSKKLSLIFARSAQSTGFKTHKKLNKDTLKAIIDSKIKLLQRLDSTQNEALFSPTLKHWFWHPIKSTQYQWLADKEARLIGFRQEAGFILNGSRRIHLLVAFLFFAGLLSHIIIILFFAGYAAQGGEIDWWYITAWGA